jgi:hypothetical protein
MQLVYHLEESDLNINFLKSLKSLFKNQKLTIVVDSTEQDETEFLLDNPVNSKRLLQSIANIEKGENLIPVDWQKFKQQLANA